MFIIRNPQTALHDHHCTASKCITKLLEKIFTSCFLIDFVSFGELMQTESQSKRWVLCHFLIPSLHDQLPHQSMCDCFTQKLSLHISHLSIRHLLKNISFSVHHACKMQHAQFTHIMAIMLFIKKMFCFCWFCLFVKLINNHEKSKCVIHFKF